MSAALQDVGIISRSNVLNVVDRNKIRRGRTKARTTLLSQVIKDYDHDQFGLYFDGRKDRTLSMEDNRRKVIIGEHISKLVLQSHSKLALQGGVALVVTANFRQTRFASEGGDSALLVCHSFASSLTRQICHDKIVSSKNQTCCKPPKIDEHTYSTQLRKGLLSLHTYNSSDEYSDAHLSVIESLFLYYPYHLLIPFFSSSPSRLLTANSHHQKPLPLPLHFLPSFPHLHSISVIGPENMGRETALGSARVRNS
ncbi:hypothetical protein AVEN_262583-1 [Araneus ventricosus]|uniref:Uncharacterized protein n=1 Tax=Araneus ventricosus TaxID=182803 RepID=A0A4Y2HIJ7_ARAVE|nr:hypothetical protein AVEN_262583-1 [Araneus ventricosus]